MSSVRTAYDDCDDSGRLAKTFATILTKVLAPLKLILHIPSEDTQGGPCATRTRAA